VPDTIHELTHADFGHLPSRLFDCGTVNQLATHGMSYSVFPSKEAILHIVVWYQQKAVVVPGTCHDFHALGVDHPWSDYLCRLPPTGFLNGADPSPGEDDLCPCEGVWEVGNSFRMIFDDLVTRHGAVEMTLMKDGEKRSVCRVCEKDSILYDL
jgi:hypothetical protein